MDFFAFLALFLGTIVAKLTFPIIPIELVIFFITISITYLITRLCGDGGDWKRLLQALVEPTAPPPAGTLAPPRTFYRAALEGSLDWMDEWLNPEAWERGDPKTHLTRAWGWRLYDKCLLLSLLYPLIFVIGQWAVSAEGVPGLIGSFVILAADATQGQRIFTAVWLILLFGYLSQRQRLTARLQSVFEGFAAVPLFGRWCVKNAKDLADLVFLAGAGAFAVAVAGAFAGAFAFAFAFAGAVAGAFAVAFAVAGAVAGAFAFAFAFAFAVAVAFAGAFAVAVAGAFAFAVVLLMVFGFGWLHKRRPILAYCLLIPAALSLYALLLANFDLNARATSLILFLGLLPLVNAQFDFLSVTATRHLLRRGLASETALGQFLWGLFDVVVGGICFFLLCLTAVTVAHAANLLSGDPVIDLNAVFTNPAAHIWLFITFLTTLLPTFLHFILALFSTAIAVCWPEWLRKTCAEQLEAHHVNGKPAAVAMRAHIAIALTAGASTAICVFLARLLWAGLGHLHLAGDFILHACAGWYDLLSKLG